MTFDLSQPYNTYRILAVDLETSGKEPDVCEPIEVAVTLFEPTGNIAGRYSSLLRTREPISDEITQLTGITNEMLQGQPSLEEVGVHIAELAKDAVPLSHNRRFDRNVLQRHLVGEGIPLFDPQMPWLCSLAMLRHAEPYASGKGRYRLANACKRRGINVVGAHRAEADTIMAAKLFFALMAESGKTPTMGDLLASMTKLEVKQDAEHAKFMKECRERDRVIWREYAKAAIGGLCARDQSACLQGPEDCAAAAAQAATELLKLERERFQ